MKSKRGLTSLAIFFIILALGAGAVAVKNFYFPDSKQSSSPEPSSPHPSGPSTPSRCSLVAQNDTYEKPDFERLKTVMQNQAIVKDVPEKGKISLKFFHFTQGCRIWDKSYLLTDSQIIESSEKGDIQVWISSSYADKINENNFCDVIKEARDNGDLGQWSDAGKATLLWRYKSMLGYADCLGIEIT